MCCTGDAEAGHLEAMAEIAEAVTQCKFEATDRESDEVVLYKILQVSSQPGNDLPSHITSIPGPAHVSTCWVDG